MITMLTYCLRRPALPLVLLILLALNGCAGQTPVSRPEAPAPRQTPPAVESDAGWLPEAVEPEPETEPAPGLKQSLELPPMPEPVRPGPAHSLYLGAEAARNSGQHSQAGMLLERALRIEPRNALYWHALARTKFDQGEFAQAVQLCLKSESLARDNPALRNANRILMEQADRRR